MEGESLAYVYERMTTLVNVMDRNKVHPPLISVNTKFLNSLQPEWSKYVTMTRQRCNLMDASYDQLYDTLSQVEPHVQASKAKKAARNHDPLVLVAHSNVHSSHSHARELQGDAQEDKLITAMINQAVIQDGRIDIQSKNVGYARNGNRNAGRQNNKAANTENDGARGNLKDEENYFMLDKAYGDDTLEELSAVVIMMAHIQPEDDKANVEPKYDVEAISEVMLRKSIS
ncbi:hypothetical protein Tco_0602562 [Tanacetum coccineum]